MDASKEDIDVVTTTEDTKDVSISMYRIKSRRVKVASAKTYQRRLLRCSCHLKYFKQERPQTTSNDQALISSIQIQWHSIFIFLVPLLFGMLQVEFQNKNKSLFHTFPVQMKTFLTSICIYCTLFGMMIHTTQTHILRIVLLLLGSLSSAALLSILFEQPLFMVLLITWGLMTIILSALLRKSSLCWILGTGVKFTWNVINIMFATIISMFNAKVSKSGSNNVFQTDRVEVI